MLNPACLPADEGTLATTLQLLLRRAASSPGFRWAHTLVHYWAPMHGMTCAEAIVAKVPLSRHGNICDWSSPPCMPLQVCTVAHRHLALQVDSARRAPAGPLWLPAGQHPEG